MNNAPLVSIIIPFLNPGAWLSEAIDSVLGQKYKNWEIILVDDGSVKADTNIAITYAKKFPGQIFYTEHDGHRNQGLTKSRNAGIQKSKGDLVAFLDADDRWLPEKLKCQVNLLIQNPTVQMTCEASVFWYSWNDETCKDEVVEIGLREGIYYPPKLMEQLYPLGEGQPPCPSGIIITKDALQRVGGFEEQFSNVYQLYEDQAFLSKVYASEIIYISATANNFYRKREGSMASAASDKELYKKVRLFYCEWLEDYFLRSGAVNPIIKKLIIDFNTRVLSS